MTQLIRKFIQDNAVNGAKILLDNNEPLRARNAANTADIGILKVTPANELELLTQPQAAAALPLPSAAKHYVTVEYIQNVIAGKTDVKDSVDALAIANLPLAGAAPLVIDDISFAAAANPKRRVALVGQADATENGIYEVTIAGANYTLARSYDADENAEVTQGLFFLVSSGTQFQGYEVILVTADPIVVGTTALSFVKYPSTLSLIAGDMLDKTGNTFSVDLAPLGGLESTNPGNVNGQLRAKVDTAALEKDQSTRRDPATGAIVAKEARRASFTLAAGDIANQYVDIPDVAGDGSVRLAIAGAGAQLETDDFTVNYTGGTGGKTRVSFAGGLAAAGVSALAVGDKLHVFYESF